MIRKAGKVHKSGPLGRKRWRFKYWLDENPDPRVKYLGPAEGREKLMPREAEILKARWLVEFGASPGKAIAQNLPTLEEHVNHYLQSIRPRYAKTSIAAIEYTIELLLSHFKPSCRIHVITPSMADAFFYALMGRGLADATLRHHLDNAKAVFRNAGGRYGDRFCENPFTHI